jgi:hypothetical protein
VVFGSAFSAKAEKGARVVCDFCRGKYYERERLCILIHEEHPSRGSRICATCLPRLGITGCTFVPGRGYEYDRLGTDEPPECWEFDRPSWREQIAALAGEWPRDPYESPSEPARRDSPRLHRA